MNADGSALQKLTNKPAEDSDPAMSQKQKTNPNKK